MNVLLVRHSYAESTSPGGDFGRELTPAGREGFASVADLLRARHLRIEQVLHSPRVRAVQTADILCDACGVTAEARSSLEFLANSYPPQELVSTLRGCRGELVAVVGHEPMVSRVASEMIGGGRLRFRPGTIANISFLTDPGLGEGVLEWLVSPKLQHDDALGDY